MSTIFFFLFLFSLVFAAVGTKNPKSIFPKKDFTKTQFFLGSLFVSFLLLSLSIATSPPSNKTDTASTPSPEVSIMQKTAQTTDQITDTSETKDETPKVTNVIDGDTVKLENGEVVRLIGIDAPETTQGGQCFATQATQKLEELVLDKKVELEKDVSETDRYNRLLRYIWLGDTLINEFLVREGFAKVSTYPPDVKYKDRFIEAERLAREENKGLWGDACVKSSSTSIPTPTPTYSPAYIPPTQTQTGGSESSTYICNCSKTCSQMSSCAEAQYQLNVCGCSTRDADGDGIACDANCQ